jgi:ornithine cyclodeaminase/alanine dehydrogenase-like protein (mu-crystallin family)
MTIYLSNDDVRSLLTYEDCVKVIDDLFRHEAEGNAENFPTTSLNLPKGFHRTKVGGAYGFGAYGLKTYGRVPGPVGVRYLVLLYSTKDGSFEAIMDAKDLGEIRTASVSAVGANHMARKNATKIGIIGTGREARGQIAAMKSVRDIKQVKCWSRTAENRASFAKDIKEWHGIETIACETAKDAVEDADIIITVSGADEPVLFGEWLKPGQHICAIGATSLFRRELDLEAVKRADLIAVENLEQSMAECGELIYAAHNRALKWKSVREMHDIVSGRVKGRPSEDAITIVDTIGVGAEDVAVAAHVLQKARERGVGVELPM